MKHLFFFVVCMSFFVSSAAAQSNQGPLFEGGVFPTVRFRTFDGKLLTTDFLKGKVVMYIFTSFNKQCPPCIAQMEGLNELYDMFSANDSVVFISGISDENATIKSFRKQYDLKYHIVSLERNEFNRFSKGFPTLILVGADGKIVKIRKGSPIELDIAKRRILAIFEPAIREELRIIHTL